MQEALGSDNNDVMHLFSSSSSQDLREKIDNLAEQVKKYKKQLKLYAKKLKDMGGRSRSLFVLKIVHTEPHGPYSSLHSA